MSLFLKNWNRLDGSSCEDLSPDFEPKTNGLGELLKPFASTPK